MARWNRYKRYYTADNSPRYITAKFDSICAETGQGIPKGTQCLYYPPKKQVFAIGSEYERWIVAMRQDEEFFGISYYRQG